MPFCDTQSTAEKYAYYRDQATAIFGICPLTTSTTTSPLSCHIGSESVQYARQIGESLFSLLYSDTQEELYDQHLHKCILPIYDISTLSGLQNLSSSDRSVTSWSHDVVSRAIRSTIPSDASDIEPRQYISWLCTSSGASRTGSSSAAQGA